MLFDQFFDRGRRNAAANIFCGLSSRGLRRLFAIYGIDEIQMKPPTTSAEASATAAAATPMDFGLLDVGGGGRERRRRRRDAPSRGDSVDSRDSSGGGGGGGNRARRSASASHRQRRRLQQQQSGNPHQHHLHLTSAARTLLGCAQSSAEDEGLDGDDVKAMAEDNAAAAVWVVGGSSADVVQDLGRVSLASHQK